MLKEKTHQLLRQLVGVLSVNDLAIDYSLGSLLLDLHSYYATLKENRHLKKCLFLVAGAGLEPATFGL
jgi:hypothetical protein